ncbi:ABC transporter substrate-binding protein [Lederbergia citrea]|uniref:ABC transporter substrate-binding protein n=1 Tax=Lederbergia citrea TaxID=2833581 RepID=UPI001BCA023A|nr:ABC transporter substrate-binding protein [Lederbergia citrea]MBS4204629.1 ABC transporter substrate-binding protein [Lederbergia citrea]
MKGKKPYILLSLLLCISVILFGCSTGSSGSSDDSGKVTLEWWSHDNPSFVAANKKFIADYEKENPNIKIKLQIFPYDAMMQKLKAAYAGKNPPDLAQVFGSWVPEYAKNGLLSEVSPVDSEWVKDNFYEPSLGSYSIGDKVFGIPHEYNLENGGILAHPEMFEKANVEYPENWEQLLDVAQKLTIRDGDKIKVKGFEFVSSDNVMFTLFSLILQQNGTYLTEDGHLNLSSPEAITAMTELKKFVTDYKITDLLGFGETESQDMFFKKQAAMVIRGPWTIGVGRDNYKTDDFDYIPMPSFTDNPPYFAAESGWGEIVAGQSKHQQEAWDFVKYMAESDQAKFFNLTTLSVPANKSVAEDPSFLEEAPLMKASLDVLQYGQFIGEGIDTDYLKKQLNDNFQLIATEKLSVEEGLKKTEEAVNKMIDKQK